jgi:outer membrane protein TolC
LVDLYIAQETVTLLQAQQDVQADNVRLVQGQYQAGAISAFELTQARLAANNALLALRDAQRLAAEARVQLADTVGVPVQALDAVQLSFAGLGTLPPVVSLADARRQALFLRSDVLSALAEYAASQAALQLEIAKQYPDVHLNPGYEFDQGDNKWQLGLTVTLPVLSRNQGPIAEAVAKREEAAANFNALQARITGDIEHAAAGFHVALQKQADVEALLAEVQRQERSAQAMLNVGEISRSELVALRLQLSAYSISRLDSLAKAQQALGQLEDALQSPLGLPATLWQNPPRVAQINQTVK